MALPAGTVTFLFTDIEGSTGLWDAFPDDMRTALALHDEVVGAAASRNGGHVVKNTGDGLFVAFSSATAAATTAIEAQADLAGADWPTVVGALGVRMALHTAGLDPEDGDYHGPDVNRVARIEAAGHGGQILLSDATAALIAGSLPEGAKVESLGTHLLRGLSMPEHIHQLSVDGRPAAFPPPRTVTTTTAKLPTFATSFVGRTGEVAEIAAQASDPSTRLVSLVGTGGAGKTRLAVEAARKCAEQGRAVAHFLSLVPVSSLDGLVKALAESLDFTIDLHALSKDFTEKDQVIDRLAMYPTVLVLDNFEHLIEEAALVQEILDGAPESTVIVTSRQRLGLQAEWIHQVGGMSITTEDGPALFLERAAQVGGTADPADPAIGRICEMVGGLPLGIELAAAWTSMLSPPEIAGEISSTLDFLTATASDVPERHRSVRAVFDYSWNLLDDAGRQALANLGVFPSSFTREAAATVAGVPLPGLFALLNKSLVQRSSVDRFDLHPLIREFALEKLGDRRDDLEEAHARHFAQFLLDRAAELGGSSNQVGVRDEVAEELDHVRVAAQWHMTHREAAECLPVLDAFLFFYFLYSWSEGADTFGRLAAIRSHRSEDPAYVTATFYHWEFAQHFVDPAEPTESLLPLLPVAEQMGPRALMWCATLLGSAANMRGELQEALDWFERAEATGAQRDVIIDITLPAWHGWTRLLVGETEAGEAILAAAEERARTAGAELGRAYLLSKLGLAADALGDHRRAADYHGAAQDVFVKFSDPSGQGYALSRLAITWFHEGDYELAIRYGHEGLEKFEAVNHRWGIAASRCRIAFPEIELGRIEQALVRLHEALDMTEAAGMREAMLYALTGIGRAWAASGDDARAATLLTYADRADNPYREFVTPVLEQLEARTEPDALAAAREAGAGMDHPAALRYARS